MSNMQYIRISVIPPAGGQETTGIYKLPVKIGRSTTDSDVHLPDETKAISRVHLELTGKIGELSLIEKSTNGSKYRDNPIHQETVTLEDTDEFEVFGYKIKVSSAVNTANTPVVFQMYLKNSQGARLADSAGKAFAPIDIGPYYVMFLVSGNGKIKFEAIPHYADHKNLLSRIHRDQMKPLFSVYPNGPAADIKRLAESEAIKVFLNGRSDLAESGLVEPGNTRRVEPLDVISFADYRLETAAKGQSALRCEHCNLLNANDHGTNCRWCGYHLVNSRTVVGERANDR
ncbi:MAG: FHA domain-containing protein [Nitratireductor sp.]